VHRTLIELRGQNDKDAKAELKNFMRQSPTTEEQRTNRHDIGKGIENEAIQAPTIGEEQMQSLRYKENVSGTSSGGEERKELGTQGDEEYAQIITRQLAEKRTIYSLVEQSFILDCADQCLVFPTWGSDTVHEFLEDVRLRYVALSDVTIENGRLVLRHSIDSKDPQTPPPELLAQIDPMDTAPLQENLSMDEAEQPKNEHDDLGNESPSNSGDVPLSTEDDSSDRSSELPEQQQSSIRISEIRLNEAIFPCNTSNGILEYFVLRCHNCGGDTQRCRACKTKRSGFRVPRNEETATRFIAHAKMCHLQYKSMDTLSMDDLLCKYGTKIEAASQLWYKQRRNRQYRHYGWKPTEDRKQKHHRHARSSRPGRGGRSKKAKNSNRPTNKDARFGRSSKFRRAETSETTRLGQDIVAGNLDEEPEQHESF